jgi:hypothetical protein
MVALMSGILSLLRELVGIYRGEKISQRSLFWHSVLIAFVLSAGVVWWQQTQTISTLKGAVLNAQQRLTNLTIPKLKGEIYGFTVAPAGKNNQDSLLALHSVTIKNTGAPSIADHFQLVIKVGNREVEAILFGLDPEVKIHLTAGTDNHRAMTLTGKDELRSKAMSQPIPTNGAIPLPNFLIGIIHGLSKEDVQQKGNKLVLRFQDINGTPVECEYLVGSGQSGWVFIEGNKIQEHHR